MMPSIWDLFPGLPRRSWKPVNLNEEYLKRTQLCMRSVEDQNRMLQELSDDDACYCFGGFGEDRTELWKGFEPGNARMVHLGVDFNNLAVVQAVASLTAGEVVDVLHDESKFN